VVDRFFSQYFFSPAIKIPPMFRIYLHFNTILARVKKKGPRLTDLKKEMLFFPEVGKHCSEKSFQLKEFSFLVSEHLICSNGLALPLSVKSCRHPWKASLFPGTFYLGNSVDKATVKLASEHIECDMSMNILLCIVTTYGLCKAIVPADSLSKAPFSDDALTLQKLLSKKATDLSDSSYKTI